MARGGRSKVLAKVDPPSWTKFGTDEEIANRDSVARQPDPTMFTQIGPDDNNGMNLANPHSSNRSGNMKFSRGVGGR